MVTIKGTECDLSIYPRIETVLNGGIDKFNEIIDVIGNIRYTIYLTAHLIAGCGKITNADAASDNRCVDKYGAMWTKIMPDNANPYSFDVDKFIANLYRMLDTIAADCKEAFNDNYDAFAATYPKIAAISNDREQIYSEIADGILPWSDISDIEYGNIENPAVVTKMLKMLFKPTFKSVNATYRTDLPDFDGFIVLFIDRTAMDGFISTGIRHGTVHQKMFVKTWIEV